MEDYSSYVRSHHTTHIFVHCSNAVICRLFTILFTIPTIHDHADYSLRTDEIAAMLLCASVLENFLVFSHRFSWKLLETFLIFDSFAFQVFNIQWQRGKISLFSKHWNITTAYSSRFCCCTWCATIFDYSE